MLWTAGITVRRVGFRALANNTDDRSCDHDGRNLNRDLDSTFAQQIAACFDDD